jgi:Family of unknown function (DUF5675)
MVGWGIFSYLRGLWNGGNGEPELSVGWSFRFWGSPVIKMKMKIIRNKKTDDALFGAMSIDSNPFTCFTIENRALEMPPGIYKVTFDYSNDFNRTMPHIWCPPRDEEAKARGDDNAGLRIHWGNWPKNYKGCVGVGDKEEPDAMDDTVATFNQLYKIIYGVEDLTLEIVEDYPV